MLSTVYGLMSKYSVDKVYIDGANPSFIKSQKCIVELNAITREAWTAAHNTEDKREKLQAL
jgi:hypothetical protein